MPKYKVGDCLRHKTIPEWIAKIEKIDDACYHIHWIAPKNSTEQDTHNVWSFDTIENNEQEYWSIFGTPLERFVRNKLETLGIKI